MIVQFRRDDGTLIRALNISTRNEAILRHDLPGETGIVDWAINALNGKVANIGKRMVTEAKQFAIDKAIAPSTFANFTDGEFVRVYIAHPDYKDRVARDAANAALRVTP